MKLSDGTPRCVEMSTTRVSGLRDLLHRWVDNGDQQAFVAVVARRGTVVLREACGAMTPAGGSPPVRLDTLFPLSSLSKPITATAAMWHLLTRGVLGGLHGEVGNGTTFSPRAPTSS